MVRVILFFGDKSLSRIMILGYGWPGLAIFIE
jgi:hypothetical protein